MPTLNDASSVLEMNLWYWVSPFLLVDDTESNIFRAKHGFKNHEINRAAKKLQILFSQT